MRDIYDILKDASLTRLPEDYIAKMMHSLPDAKSVDRVQFLTGLCRGKVVVHIGCVGPLHGILKKEAKKIYGVDIVPSPEIENMTLVDLDSPALAHYHVPEDAEVVLLAEVLEHLSNPGGLLKHLKSHPAPKVITVPNAFSAVGFKNLQRGTEAVNREHVCYYSWHTLKTLVERFDYTIQQFSWYGGPPVFSEGLIMVVQ